MKVNVKKITYSTKSIVPPIKRIHLCFLIEGLLLLVFKVNSHSQKKLMKQNYLVTPETFYKRKAGEIIYGYAVQPECCFEIVKLDKEKSD